MCFKHRFIAQAPSNLCINVLKRQYKHGPTYLLIYYKTITQAQSNLFINLLEAQTYETHLLTCYRLRL